MMNVPSIYLRPFLGFFFSSKGGRTKPHKKKKLNKKDLFCAFFASKKGPGLRNSLNGCNCNLF